jgi:zinc protease
MPQGYAYSRAFYDHFYRPENTVVIIAGDFDFEKAKGLIRTHYGRWRRGYQPAAVVPGAAAGGAAPADGGVSRPDAADRRDSSPCAAWDPGRSHRRPRSRSLDASAFGPNSPLYRRLVLQERRAQSLGGSFERARDPYIADRAGDGQPARGRHVGGGGHRGGDRALSARPRGAAAAGRHQAQHQNTGS